MLEDPIAKPCSCHAQDVFKPEPPRLRRHLSAIINFAKFREEKALAFQELQVSQPLRLQRRTWLAI